MSVKYTKREFMQNIMGLTSPFEGNGQGIYPDRSGGMPKPSRDELMRLAERQAMRRTMLKGIKPRLPRLSGGS